MAVCGFNQKMLDGLRDFSYGLFIQTCYQAKTKGIDLNNIFPTNTESNMALCGFNQKMLDGLKDYSEGLLEQTQKQVADEKSFAGIYQSEVKTTLQTFFEQDALYYDKLRPELGPDKGIAEWVKSFKQTPQQLHPRTIRGVTLFAKGLYEQAKVMAKKHNTSLEEAYDNEMKEMAIALDTLAKEFAEEL